MLEEGSVAGPFHEQVPTTLTLEPHFGSASVGGWSHLRRKYELRLLYTQGSVAEEGLYGRGGGLYPAFPSGLMSSKSLVAAIQRGGDGSGGR